MINRLTLAKLALTALLTVSASSANAITVPVDLTSWSALTLNFPGGQNAGNWVLQSGNTAVKQIVNADPSFFLNNLNQTSYSIDGTWQVATASDDDFMGFVFGYQNSSNFYLFDWKQLTQNNVYEFPAGNFSDANEGMTIKKYTGGTGNGLVDLSLGEFWENNAASLGGMTRLATNHGSTQGWADNTEYNFHLDFNVTSGEFSILVKQGATTLWDVTVNDTTFTSGQFGFYNFSQENVLYAGFEQTGGVIVDTPEPATLAIFGLGLAGLGLMRRRKRVAA